MAVGAAIGGVAAGIYSSEKASKNASKSIDQQGDAIAQQNAIARQQLAMAQDQYDYYKQTYRPIEQDIAAEAGLTDAEQQKMVTTAGLTSASAFDNAEASRNRNLQRMGINPNSGAYAESTRKSAIAKAVAKANSQNNARAQAEQMDYSQKVAAVGLGKGLTSSAANLMNSASGNYASQASAYGTQAQMYGNSASKSMQLGMGIAGAALGAQNDDGSFSSSKFGKGLIGVA